MQVPVLSAGELAALADTGGPAGAVGERAAAAVLVDLTSGLGPWPHSLRWWPGLVVGVGPDDTHASALGTAVDVVVVPEDRRLGAVIEAALRWPIASSALALLLRAAADVDARTALVAESATYSALQAGTEFARWRADRPGPVTDPSTAPAVRLEEADGATRIVFSRPHRHNAIDRRLRLELHDALRVAATRPGSVVLAGDGPSFSSGGDLAEFGAFADPATWTCARRSTGPASGAGSNWRPSPGRSRLGPTRSSSFPRSAWG
jgi:hypothetical protein